MRKKKLSTKKSLLKNKLKKAVNSLQRRRQITNWPPKKLCKNKLVILGERKYNKGKKAKKLKKTFKIKWPK